MARKGKYEPELVQVILDAIAITGSDRAAYEKACINRDTFYQWLKRHPAFAEGVAQARREFRESCGDAMIRRAQQALADYLFDRVEESWDCEDEAINPKTGEIETLTSKKRVKRGVPQWVIERVLGKPIHDLSQLRAIADECGFALVPRDAELFEKYIEQFGSAALQSKDRSPNYQTHN